jgi:hypothetical protein
MKTLGKFLLIAMLFTLGFSSCTRDKMSIEDEQTFVGDTLDLQQGVGEGEKPNEPNTDYGAHSNQDK